MPDLLDATTNRGNNVHRVSSRNSQLTLAEQASRRASIASAIASITKFKESWMSVMFLKASVGLGQVVVLITLLILASLLDSPLAPFRKQSVPSDACPQPVLFRSWMIVQIFRLIICWSISCWVAFRQQRTARRESIELETSEEPRIVSTGTAPCTPGGQISVPCLTHSSSSTSSNATMVNYPLTAQDDVTATPGSSYPPTVHSRSSASLDLLSRQMDIGQSKKVARHYGLSPDTPVQIARPGNTNLDLARANHRGQEESSRSVSIADRLEVLAPKATKLLGGFSFVLFVLGNVLLFHPLPSQQETCYHASPMLWWGVMTVTGVGWFLFGQILLVVLFIAIGGSAILTLLRRLPFFPAPAEPEPPRAPQPAPLTAAELANVKIVCYIPDPDADVSTTNKTMADAQPATPARKWDYTRFPYTPHTLKPHQATCAICQDNFTEPETVRRLLYQAEPLRLLNCGHVYHADCIDKWLTGTSGICPSCNRGVRDDPQVKEDGEKAERRRWYRSRAPASSAALASATA